MDIATVLGLLGGFGLVVGAIFLGGSLGAFIDIPSVLIVVAGTLMVTTISYSLQEMIKAQGLYMKTLFFSAPNLQEEVKFILSLAQKSRANGLLSIQSEIEKISNEHLKKSLTLAVDGSNPEFIEGMMKTDSAAMSARHGKGIDILRRSAEVAPAMGLIGTLIGLVQMLGNLSDPNSIGPSMAVALLTTMYGAILSNMVFNPLAAKLERNSGIEIAARTIYLYSVLSMVKQENPRQLEVNLNALLEPKDRVSVFD
ncbi:MAG: flagellar motor protein MotA [Proteobacteria bacterium]|nr:flagellar motor protein MotA [Pseudomonadota bacterium]